MISIYLYDPQTFEFMKEISNPIEIPINSTHQPIIKGQTYPQYFVNGQWTFDNPITPEIEHPIIPITAIQIQGGELVGNIWELHTKQVVTLVADIPLPNSSFNAIVQKIVDRLPVSDLRFKAIIAETEGLSRLSLPLYFEESGNFQISAKRLNQGLEEIGKSFRVSFETVDIDVLVSIPVS